MQYLRSGLKLYVAFIPGAGIAVDVMLDKVEWLHEQHKEEVEAIVGKAYNDIRMAVEDSGMNESTAGRVIEILKMQGKELADLAVRVGGGPVMDQQELDQELDKSVQELKDLIQQKVKEVQEKGGAIKDRMEDMSKDSFETSWNSVKSWVRTVPGGDNVVDSAEDFGVADLSTLVASRKDEAQDLIKETYADIVKVFVDNLTRNPSLASEEAGERKERLG